MQGCLVFIIVNICNTLYEIISILFLGYCSHHKFYPFNFSIQIFIYLFIKPFTSQLKKWYVFFKSCVEESSSYQEFLKPIENRSCCLHRRARVQIQGLEITQKWKFFTGPPYLLLLNHCWGFLERGKGNSFSPY